ncbi:HSF-type DNA-binding protein [Nitzschia inconspicua]|uniref:HSF-type DNA-binding protein n=1 Tax=Nitzschia inconspicua TaxID=303405 RepID=A0A9K3L3P7_9STRA|nr:HSF-type DNA-binding protein [Nitzschia inconspicua]
MSSSLSSIDQATPQAPRSLLSILPCEHVRRAEALGTVTNPGLVSPTDSQPGMRKEVLPPLSVVSHSTPILYTHSTLVAGKDQLNDPTPIVPRPTCAMILPKIPCYQSSNTFAADLNGPVRLNKFVRRLHDMLVIEKDSGIVEWRRGLLVLFSTDAFTKRILPKYFNTRNFKTFRRQLNYYGFVHVRSFSATGSSTTALWINQHLAENEANDDISAVLKLRRVEPNETTKTVEGRRQRKELALHTVEEDIGLDTKTLQMDQIRSMAIRGEECGQVASELVLPPHQAEFHPKNGIPRVVHIQCDDDDDRSHVSSLPNPIENSAVAANMLLMLARS